LFASLTNVFAASGDVLEARMVSPKYRNAIYASMGTVSKIKLRITSSLTDTELASCNALVTLSGHGANKAWTFTNLHKFSEQGVRRRIKENAIKYGYIEDDKPKLCNRKIKT
jgi:hypothetical protein